MLVARPARSRKSRANVLVDFSSMHSHSTLCTMSEYAVHMICTMSVNRVHMLFVMPELQCI